MLYIQVILTAILTALKLDGVITWSWLGVFFPMWLPWSLLIIISLICYAYGGFSSFK